VYPVPTHHPCEARSLKYGHRASGTKGEGRLPADLLAHMHRPRRYRHIPGVFVVEHALEDLWSETEGDRLRAPPFGFGVWGLGFRHFCAHRGSGWGLGVGGWGLGVGGWGVSG
jgi:hypothetical protein